MMSSSRINRDKQRGGFCIVWDWNGTLLNDVDVCVDTINRSLSSRNLKELDADTYRRVFTFPVRDYYRVIGFDFKKYPFDLLAQEFMDIYREDLKKASLFSDVKYALDSFQSMGLVQVVLSAMEQSLLEKYLDHFGILKYFSSVQGVGDDYADGKEKVAEKLLNRIGAKPERTVLIGDTLHDHEVARMLGVRCLLVARGHQSRERLIQSNIRLFDNLEKVVEYVKDRTV